MKAQLVSLFVLSVIAASAQADAGMELAQKKNCLACHSVDHKVVGPAYKDVAAKYAKDKGAVEKLSAKIIKGGSGVWGAVPMPPNPRVSPEEAKQLANWVLTTK